MEYKVVNNRIIFLILIIPFFLEAQSNFSSDSQFEFFSQSNLNLSSSYDVYSQEITKMEIRLTDNFLEKLSVHLMSGQEQEIKTAVHRLVHALPNVAMRMNTYERHSQVSEVGKTYFNSGLNGFKQLKGDINSPVWVFSIKAHGEDLDKVEEIKSIVRNLRLALLFFSLDGFHSLDGKVKYINTFLQFQLLLTTLFRLYKHSQLQKRSVKIQNEGEKNQNLEAIVNFQKFYKQLVFIYFEVIEPSFQKLSWLQNELKNSSFQRSSIYRQISDNHNRLKNLVTRFALLEEGSRNHISDSKERVESTNIKEERGREKDLVVTRSGENEVLDSKEQVRSINEAQEKKIKNLKSTSTNNMDSLRGFSAVKKDERKLFVPEKFIVDDKVDMEAVRGIVPTKPSDVVDFSTLENMSIVCEKAFLK